MQRRTRSAKISAESAMCPMTSTAVQSPNRTDRSRSAPTVRTMRASVAASSASVNALSSSNRRRSTPPRYPTSEWRAGSLIAAGDPLLERAQVVGTAEEVADELRGRLGTAGREDLVAIAQRDGGVHEIAVEGRVQILGDRLRPDVRVVGGGVVVAVHVLPVGRRRRPRERPEESVAFVDVPLDGPRIIAWSRAVVEREGEARAHQHLTRPDGAAEVARRAQALDELRGDRRAGVHVGREAREHAVVVDPILEERGWRFHEV